MCVDGVWSIRCWSWVRVLACDWETVKVGNFFSFLWNCCLLWHSLHACFRTLRLPLDLSKLVLLVLAYFDAGLCSIFQLRASAFNASRLCKTASTLCTAQIATSTPALEQTSCPLSSVLDAEPDLPLELEYRPLSLREGARLQTPLSLQDEGKNPREDCARCALRRCSGQCCCFRKSRREGRQRDYRRHLWRRQR